MNHSQYDLLKKIRSTLDNEEWYQWNLVWYLITIQETCMLFFFQSIICSQKNQWAYSISPIREKKKRSLRLVFSLFKMVLLIEQIFPTTVSQLQPLRKSTWDLGEVAVAFVSKQPEIWLFLEAGIWQSGSKK